MTDPPMCANTRHRSFAVSLFVGALLVSSVAVVVSPALAAGETDVRLEAETDRLAVGETTTIGISVTDADGGVGAYNMTVSLPGAHARITNASVSDARLTRVDISADGSTARLVVALQDTPQQGSVSVATLTVEATSPGRSDVALRVASLGDEGGHPYRVGEATGTTLEITEHASPTVTTDRPTPGTATSHPAGTTASLTPGMATDSPDVADHPTANTPLTDASDGTSLDSLGRVTDTATTPMVVIVLLVAGLALGFLLSRRD